MIETRNLTKMYGDQTAVNEVNLSVPKASIYGFLGQNGAGKTTTIKMLTGLIRPTSGSGTISGFDIVRDSLSIRRIIGVLPEEFKFYPSLSVFQALMYIGRLDGVKENLEDRVLEVIELTDLTKYKLSKVGTLSRGLNRRFGLAQALQKNPKVLILDEATSGLDPIARREIHILLRKLNKERGVTVFFSTHILSEVIELCDRFGILRDGILVTEENIDLLAKKGENKLEELMLNYMEGSG
ncbi:MAG: ABC transporter ATP-binding protein [Promethearchaeota archaeon]